MAEEIAALGIVVDATQVDAAKPKLDGLTQSGDRLEKQTAKVTKETKALATAQAEWARVTDKTKAATDGANASLERNSGALKAARNANQEAAAAAGALASAQQQAAGATVNLAASQERLASSTRTLADYVPRLSGGMKQQVDFANSLAASVPRMAAAYESAGKSIGQVGTVSKNSSYLVTNLGFQLNDVATGLAMGQSPFRILAQQGGQFVQIMQQAGGGPIGLIKMMGAALGPVGIAAVATGAAIASGFAVATQQINKTHGDLTKGMGLTAEQLDRVSNRYVTFGDTIKATFQVAWDRIKGGFGGVLEYFGKGYQWLVDKTTWVVETYIGIWVGAFRLVQEAYKSMPTWLGGEGKSFSFEGLGKAFTQGLAEGRKATADFFSDVSNQAVKNATDRIKKEAGEAKKDRKGESQLDSAEKLLTETQNQTLAQQKLNDAVAKGTMTVEQANEQSKIDSQLKSVIADRDNASGALKAKLTAIIEKLTPAMKALNDEQRKFQLLSMVDAQNDQIGYLQKQLELIGATNKERAISLAQFKAEQELKSGKFGDYNKDAPTATQQAYLDNAKKQAELTVDLQVKTDNYNNSLRTTADLMAQINDNAQKAAAGLAEAFGPAGEAIGNAVTALTQYRSTQADLDAQQEDLNKRQKEGYDVTVEQILLTRKRGEADDDYYTGTLSAAKNLFDKQSAGYKALQAIEGVYHAIKLANTFAQMSAEMAGAATTVAASGIKTAAYATETGAGVAAGAANIFAQLGPWGFPVVAAMVGVMASLGFGGGSGGGSAPAVDVAKERQAAQGSGTVLGDSAAKSESIAKSIEQLTKDTNTDLQYSNQMVTSLKAIENGIGSLTGLLARQLQVGGLFDTSSLNLGTTESKGLLGSIPIIGGILGGLFGGGSKTTTELQDQGINVGATTVGNAIAGAIAANAYQTVKTTKTSSGFLGIGGGTKTSTATTNTPLSGDFTSEIQSIVSGLRNTVLEAANQLGIQGAQEVIDSLAVNIGNISFKDMTGSEIQDALNAVFSKLGDQMVEAAVPQVQALQKVGEGALETLSRLVAEYNAVDAAMKSMGKSFDLVGISSLEARDRLVQASGGLDEFTSQAQFFVDNFIEGSAALKPIATAVQTELSRLGVSGVETKEQFAALVQGIDVTTASGASLYAQLMNVAPAFAKVAEAAENLASKKLDLQIKLLQAQGDTLGAAAMQREKELAALDASLVPLQKLIYATQDLAAAQALLKDETVDAQTAVTNAHNDLVAAYNAEQQALQNTITKFKGLSSSLSDFYKTLNTSDLANNNPLTQYAITKEIFERTAALAKGGDETALGNLQTDAQNFLAASKSASVGSTQYNRDLAAVRGAVLLSANAAQSQADVAQQQLDALNESVSKLDILNKSVLTVRDAINNLTVAQAALDAQNQKAKADAQAAIDKATAALAQAKAEYEAQAAKDAADKAAADAALKAAAEAAAQRQAQEAAAAQAQAAFASLKAAADSLLAQRDAILAKLGPQGDTYVDQNYATGQLGGYMNYYTYQNNATGLALVQQAQQLNAQYVDAFNKALEAYRSIPGHASGLGYVPYDDYYAKLHQGERVLTREENREYSSKRAEASGDGIDPADVAAMKRLLANIEKNTRDGTKVLKDVTQGGDSIRMTDAT